MASLYTDATGPYLVFQFPRPRGPESTHRRRGSAKRYKVRLTGWSEERCAWALHHVEKLTHAARMGRPIELATTRWVQRDAPPSLREALADSGLVDDRRTLGPAVDAWIHAQAPRVTPSRLDDLQRVAASLLSHLGPTTEVAHCTADLVADWAERLTEGHATNTVAKYGRIARQFFRWLTLERLADTNPAAGLAITFRAASARHFIPPAAVLELIAAAQRSNRLAAAAALALARFGGLRIGEVLRFRTTDIEWSSRSMRVRDTKRNQLRTLPLFPEVADVLEHWRRFADDLSPVGDVHPNRRSLHRSITDVAAAIDRPLWPRLFHNLRASRESELLERFAQKDVLLWIGNTEAVAMKHYALTRDETFARAAETRTETTPPTNPQP